MINTIFEKWIKDNGWFRSGAKYLGGGDSAVATRSELYQHWKKVIANPDKFILFKPNPNHFK